jgi:hypothetical protein
MNQYPHSGDEQNQPSGSGSQGAGRPTPDRIAERNRKALEDALHPWRRARRVLFWIAVGLLTASIGSICALVGGSYALAAVQISPASGVVNAFCSDLQNHNYTAAYGLLSSSLQRRVTQQQFVHDAQQGDQMDGRVQSCNLQDITDPIHYGGDGHVGADLTVVRKLSCLVVVDLAEQGRTLLVLGNWKIDEYGASGNNDLTTPGCLQWYLENDTNYAVTP